MPEYLSPGVYVEEVDTGSKPIEGVSTSTAGLLGVTERGPASVPILITSTGEFDRWFGGKLNRSAYSNGSKDPHCYLPDAVEGFFANGGKRVYVTRVEANGAPKAETTLHIEPPSVFASTTLLRSAGRGSGLAAEPLVVFDVTSIDRPPAPALGDILRVGDGSASEYRYAIATDPTALPDADVIVLTEPLQASVAKGAELAIHAVDAGAPTYTVVGAFASGKAELEIHPSTAWTAGQEPAAGDTLQIGSTLYDIAQVLPGTALADRKLEITPALAAPLANGDPVQILVPRAAYTLDGAMVVGALGGRVSAASPTIVPAVGDHITIDGDRFVIATSGPAPIPADPARTFDLTFTLATPAKASHNLGAKVVFDPLLALDASPGSVALVAITAPAPATNTLLVVPDTAGGRSRHTVGTATRVTSTTPLPADAAVGDLVRQVAINVPPSQPAYTSTADAKAGATGIYLDQRTQLSVGQLVAVGTAPDVEYRAIRSLPSPNTVGPDPGLVVFDLPLRDSHAVGASLSVVTATATGTVGSVLAPAGAGATSMALSGVPAVGVVAIEHADNTSSLVTVNSVSAVTAGLVTLNGVLERAHGAGAPVVERVELLDVAALDSGIWGDRLQVAVEREAVGLVTPTKLAEKVDPTHIRLVSPVGVESGTVLELLDRNGDVTDQLLKVTFIDRHDKNLITLAVPLTPYQQAEIAAAGLTNQLRIRSLEFRLTVELLHQPDAARPKRDELVIASEVFPHLSMDPRHSRYVQTIIGDSDNSAPKRLSDRRSYGESRFIRVRDVHFADVPKDVVFKPRVGPEALVDVLPTGVRRPARLALDGGDDLIPTIDDTTYIGVDNVVPELRTGLHSFRNIDAISILGCPGRTSVPMQTALINHCEELRYRFAVLDSVGAPDDTITDVQAQRQNYDSKYAALYYPWLMVPEVFPSNLATANQEPIPPSGHMLGLYARIDNERGVHKAPANEVVRGGIVDLRRTLNKGEHDILNPYPTNINVIRDFRPNNRAIRVYGARVITSDPDWKYVNVRRLLIFIEKSIDLGLQWVVFEPNAEPLWARVKRSVSQFLITVWRNGALEGTTKEEAFFVKCDRSTMTQADIDNGRLIIEVGVAPVKPAEFVIVRIGLFTAHADD